MNTFTKKRLPFIKDKKMYLLALGVIMILSYAMILLPKELFFGLIEEDGVFENLTALFFLVTAVAFFLIFFNRNFLNSSELRSIYNSKARRYVFLLLGIVFFFGFGEEISWGQRILGFNTPDYLSEKNAQNEFNIHNLELFNIRGTDGVRKDSLSKLFTMKQLFLYTFLSYLLFIPLLDRYSEKFKSLFERFYLPIPPLFLGIFFLSNYVLYRILRFATDDTIDLVMTHGMTEMQEFNFSILLFLLPFAWFRFFTKNTS